MLETHVPTSTLGEYVSFHVLFNKSEREALHKLKQNRNIIIKEADKGSAIVIMDAEFYERKIRDVT